VSLAVAARFPSPPLKPAAPCISHTLTTLPAAHRSVCWRHERPPRRASSPTGGFPQLKRLSPSLALVVARRLAPPPHRAALAGNRAAAAAATASCRCAARRPPLRPNPSAHRLPGDLVDLPDPFPTGPAEFRRSRAGRPPRTTLRGSLYFRRLFCKATIFM
jgi:hypothetical protein